MTKYNLENNTMWAVVATCTAKNNGKYEDFERIIATFNYPDAAQHFIDKCLPQESKERFEVTAFRDRNSMCHNAPLQIVNG